MFIDSVKITLASGRGGRGAVSFRREKHVPLGGPDGGDGGRGGDVVFICRGGLHTLAAFRGKKHFAAANGAQGQGRNKRGKSGADLQIPVPPGTQLIDDETGELLGDLIREGQREILLRGGLGGLGNSHFKGPTNQRPDYAQPGLPGQSLTLRLELKLIADVGLVGFPNAGKSTLISVLSKARPQIADYEFTTLTPKLGLVEFNDPTQPASFVMADIPGLIEGASAGRGLGTDFLRHIERTGFLLFILDPLRGDLAGQLHILRGEIKAFSPALAEKKYALAISKMDALDAPAKNALPLDTLTGLDPAPTFTLAISSLDKTGLAELKANLLAAVRGEG